MDKAILLQKFAALTAKPCLAAPSHGTHLYHHPMSFCSQYVRVAMALKGIPYQSHFVSLSAFDQYSPDYVDLNPRGVVPTLVVDGKVTTDSLNICKHLDEVNTSTQLLVPEDPETRERVLKSCNMVDEMKIFVITYGNCHHPDADKRPFMLRQSTKNTTQESVAITKKLLREHQNDPVLKEFYETRLKLSETLNTSTRTDIESVREAVDDAARRINELEIELQTSDTFQSNGGYLHTAQPSLADVLWCTVLNRFQYLGLQDKLWKDDKHPNVVVYADKLFAMDAFKQGVRDWESVPFVLLPLMLKRKVCGFSIK